MDDGGEGPRGLSWLDRLVDALARALDGLGFNGTRLRWKWNRRRANLAETGALTNLLWRSATSPHKMCPSCRALVERSASRCHSCGSELASVRAPGIGRLVANVLPGATAATSLILLANGFWFLLCLMADIREGGGGFGALWSFDGELLYQFGSGFSPATLSGEWWRLVTPIFLHGGVVHFFFNSYVLLQLGPIVEEEFGTERFWVVYLVSGIAGAATSQFVRPVHTVGASGAIFGLMGLLLVHGWLRGGASGTALRQAMTRYLIYMVVFSLLVSGIDHLNHAGGLAAGALAGLVVPSGTLQRRAAATAWKVAAALGVLLVLVCFFLVAVELEP